MKKSNSLSHLPGCVCGSTSLGARGQIVIPKLARERLKLKEGDRFLVVEHMGKLVFAPESELRMIIQEITKHLTI
ncbi:MAG: AbrB/MazE/SpoVT family DNA-binding domain-containing protein [Patescibacteria group bacterium]